MKIYTKTGDKGETSLFGGRRVPKTSLRIEAYGTADELNSVIGLCRASNSANDIDIILEEIQNDLFALGTDLATPLDSKSKQIKRIAPSDIERLEKHIDDIDPYLELLREFILPGGNRAAATLHLARTVCRRTERLVVQLNKEEKINEYAVVYLNRLSDLLFVLARWSNALSHTPEVKWKG
ncbi:MAG: cob(I)yrinic acid a,c-diamide adenosyltransferase [Bacteroidota bacterium]